jgi:hypothetical protein
MQDLFNLFSSVLQDPMDSKTYIFSGSIFFLLVILAFLVLIIIQKNNEIRELHEIFMRRSQKGGNEPPETKIYFRKRKR